MNARMHTVIGKERWSYVSWKVQCTYGCSRRTKGSWEYKTLITIYVMSRVSETLEKLTIEFCFYWERVEKLSIYAKPALNFGEATDCRIIKGQLKHQRKCRENLRMV